MEGKASNHPGMRSGPRVPKVHTARGRDLALRRLRRTRQTLVVLALAASLGFSALAARAFPGHAPAAQAGRNPAAAGGPPGPPPSPPPPPSPCGAGGDLPLSPPPCRSRHRHRRRLSPPRRPSSPVGAHDGAARDDLASARNLCNGRYRRAGSPPGRCRRGAGRAGCDRRRLLALPRRRGAGGGQRVRRGARPRQPAAVRGARGCGRGRGATGGVVDPTVGAALELAGYDRDLAESRPTGRRCLTVGAGCGLAQQCWTAHPNRARAGRCPARPGRDRESARRRSWRRRRGLGDGDGLVLSLGGDVAVGGTPPPGGWPVALGDDHAAPNGPVVALAGGGLATSSTTVRRWRRGDQVVHHILDPATGAPCPTYGARSPSPPSTCVQANVASTAAIVLGAGPRAGWPGGASPRDSCGPVARSRRSAAGSRRRRDRGTIGALGDRSLWYLSRGTGGCRSSCSRSARARHRRRAALVVAVCAALRDRRPAP